MKLIFAVDAIFPPLTGIGRYAWELASGLAKCPEASDVRYFSFGRFVGNPALAPQPANTPNVAKAKPPLRARLRAQLAGSRAAVNVYRTVSPSFYKWKLRNYSDHLFHSPNYFLPHFDGAAVATLHDLSTMLYPEFHPAARVAFMNAELPKTLKRATHLVTDSEHVRAQVIEQFAWPADKITAIGLGVDARFHPRPQQVTQTILDVYGLKHGAYVLSVATIEPRKNIERLVEAHMALPEALRLQHPLVLAGGAGWNSEALHARIKALQGPGLHYLNYVPQEHLYALYAGARVFAFTSIYEGFGLPVLEAMASGTPVLISDSPSLVEVACGAAWAVNPLDVDDIRQGLLKTLQDDAWRQTAIDAGLRSALAQTWERCFEQTHQLYHRLQASAL